MFDSRIDSWRGGERRGRRRRRIGFKGGFIRHRKTRGRRCGVLLRPHAGSLAPYPWIYCSLEYYSVFAKSFHHRVSRRSEHRFFDHIKIHFHAAAHDSTTEHRAGVLQFYLRGPRFAGDEINSEVCARARALSP